MKRPDAVLEDTEKIIAGMNRQQAIKFVRQIVEQLNENHGDSFNQEHGFEFATLYFP